jgi:NAD(P)-dependent dehydrogenase (short-subunit alcohol dehydrogenase family)
MPVTYAAAMTDTRPVAFVTGASRGIGAATAVALAGAGYDLALTARTVHEGEGRKPGSLDSTMAEVEKTGVRALPVQMDLVDRDAVRAAAERALQEFGHVDVLCNIGIYQGEHDSGLFLDTPIDEFARHLEGGVLAPAVLLQTILPSMIERGGGTVLNMTSFVAVNDPPGTALENGWSLAYAVTKAGIDRFAGILNVELGDRGIRAYTVDPGFVAYGDDFDEMVERYVGMPVTPREAVAAAIMWLLSSPDAGRLLHKRVYLPAIAQKYDLLPGWKGPGTPFPQ